MSQPLFAAVEAAIMAARESPCQKSQRGAVLYHRTTNQILKAGFNSRPDMACDALCQPKQNFVPTLKKMVPVGEKVSRCSQMCLHAEQRAIRFALHAGARSLESFDLIHVKVQQRELVMSGPPSCIFCAKEIDDVGLGGVWLYELDTAISYLLGEQPAGKWNYYSTRLFWKRTLEENGIHG